MFIIMESMRFYDVMEYSGKVEGVVSIIGDVESANIRDEMLKCG